MLKLTQRLLCTTVGTIDLTSGGHGKLASPPQYTVHCDSNHSFQDSGSCPRAANDSWPRDTRRPAIAPKKPCAHNLQSLGQSKQHRGVRSAVRPSINLFQGLAIFYLSALAFR